MSNNPSNEVKNDDANIQNVAADDLKNKAQLLGISYLEKSPNNVVSNVINAIPEDFARRYQIVAFDAKDDLLKVAIIDPQNIDVLNALRFIAESKGVQIEQYITSQKVFEQLLEFYKGANVFVKEAVETFNEKTAEELAIERALAEKDKKKAEVLRDAPVAKLVEVVVNHAIEGKASDIHIEPMDDEYRVRFRVDGVLHVSLILPREIGPIVVSRIKILSNLKIEEKRKPQDGRFRMVVGGKQYDFRVSTLPVLYGEKVVMRILDKEGGTISIESLGLLGTALDNMKAAIQETFGMILITGPTGSGKSTTTYAMLRILNREERNIITLEDPIEYNIEGLNQSQVNPDIGYTFASGLRTILRQDPNIILVGEIRDRETAELAVHAALTGHLLFSTLHTNTAIGAFPRLVDMGIEPFLLASSLRLAVAQRLVRRICEDCKEERKVSEVILKKINDGIKNISQEEMSKYGLDIKEGMKFYRGKGCEACGKTGLRGRVAVYEVIPVTDPIKDIVMEKESSETLIEQERDKMGVLTMKQDGILKALLGLTTLEEVERVTEGDFSLEEDT